MTDVARADADAPVLVAASHGTSDPVGQAAVAGLVAAVRERLPGVEVRDAFVDVQQPAAEDLVSELVPRPVVVVPLLLSAGYHVYVDLTRASTARPGVALAAALGPDRRLTERAAAQLRVLDASLASCASFDSAGSDDGQLDDCVHVVLAAAGSSDARAVADCARAAEDLAARLGRPVTPAYLSAASPRVAEAITALRADHPQGRILVASYLLAPGYFQDLLVRHATEAGADGVTGPLLAPGEPPDPALVDLVVERYVTARDRAATGTPPPG